MLRNTARAQKNSQEKFLSYRILEIMLFYSIALCAARGGEIHCLCAQQENVNKLDARNGIVYNKWMNLEMEPFLWIITDY